MRFTKQLTVAVVTATTLVSSASGASAGNLASSNSTSASSGTLIVAVPSWDGNLEPATNLATPVGSEIIENVFDTLVDWRPPNFQTLEGRLAKSWTVSHNGLDYTFTLRSGIMFQDGTPFNAEAVKFSLERTKKLNSYTEATLGLIKAINVTSPTQLTISLTQPDAAFLSMLAQPQSAIVSPTAVKKYGTNFNEHPVGTGPFEFSSEQSGSSVTLVANPSYFRGAPKLSRLIFEVVPSATTAQLDLENGSVDIIDQQEQLSNIDPAEVASFKKDPNIQVIQESSQIIRQLEFNNNATTGPFTNVKAREAIAYAINYNGLLKDVFGGTAQRVYGPVPTNSWAFDPEIKKLAPTYDPTRAKELLKSAGIDPASLHLTMYTYQGALWGAVATYVQSDLANIGLNVKIEQLPFPQYRDLQTAGKFEIALDGRQPWYNDPSAHITIGYLSSLASSAMTFRMPENKQLDNLITRAQEETNQVDRKALYYKIQVELEKWVPAAYLYSPDIVIFARKDVHGLVVNSAPPLSEFWSVTKS